MNLPGPTKMSLIDLHFEQRKRDTMPRVSVRTLILMLELLVAVVTWQYVTIAEPIQARVIWLAADGHTASMVRERVADPIATTTPAPATADEGVREP